MSSPTGRRGLWMWVDWRAAVRVSVAIILGIACCVLPACVESPWGDDTEEVTPLTPESTPVADAPGAAPPVRRADPLVRPGERTEGEILRSVDPAEGRMSSPYRPTPTTGPAYADPADGDQISRRTGRMKRADGGSWTFVFASQPDVPALRPMTILPNAFLEQMETIVAGSGDAGVLFGISGEITRYRGRNYLVIRRAVVRAPSPGP